MGLWKQSSPLGLHPSGAQGDLPGPKDNPSPSSPEASQQVRKAPAGGGPGPLPSLPGSPRPLGPSTKRQTPTAKRGRPACTLCTARGPEHLSLAHTRKGAQLQVPGHPVSPTWLSWSELPQGRGLPHARREGVVTRRIKKAQSPLYPPGPGRRGRAPARQAYSCPSPAYKGLPSSSSSRTWTPWLCPRRPSHRPTQNENLGCPLAQALPRGRNPHICVQGFHTHVVASHTLRTSLSTSWLCNSRLIT